MDNYYSLLGVDKNASLRDIKKAFRERAKQLHPDIAGKAAEEAMRKLLSAYETLSSKERRFEYDHVFARLASQFDYPTFLKKRKTDPVSQAKLLFYLLLHPGNEQFDPIEVWKENGGLDFLLEQYLEREDWMDCSLLLAEELDRRGQVYEAYSLMYKIKSNEKEKPYFKHFMEDVDTFYKKLNKKLKKSKKTARVS
ncbi:MAG: DnaJ domain-containing protein [Treponema sp.]|nr:DnaJ domain-containing protein [Treponema sp.]